MKMTPVPFSSVPAGRKSIRIDDPLSEHPLAYDPVSKRNSDST